MRAGTGLWVVLHRQKRHVLVNESFECLIVEADMSGDATGSLQRLRIHRETVILRRDLHPSREQIAHRVIRSAVAELEFERLGSQRKRQQLVPQANAKDWHSTAKPLEQIDRIVNRGRIARTIRDENAIRPLVKNLGSGNGGRDHPHPTACVRQIPQNVSLHSAVDGNDKGVFDFRFSIVDC